MKVATFIGIFAILALSSASSIELQNSDNKPEETNFLIASTINSTVESIRLILAEYDPVSLNDFSYSIDNVGDVSLTSLSVSGFSDFALTSLSVSVLFRRATATLRFDKLSVAIKELTSSIDILNANTEVNEFDLDLDGLTIDISLSYNLLTPQLTALSVLPQIDNIQLVVDAILNDNEISISVDSDELLQSINEGLQNIQEELSARLREGINYLLNRFINN